MYQLTGSPSADSSSAPHTPAMYGDSARSHLPTLSMTVPTDSELQVSGIGCPLYTPAECTRCFETYSTQAREDELTASIKLAQVLKNLESVRWSSWFSASRAKVDGEAEYGKAAGVVVHPEGEEDVQGPGWTQVWILRKAGRIRVRRTPW
ncbi:hypothetical protein BV25DRAFT_1831331, partial [Artomyces pyxidatus]